MAIIKVNKTTDYTVMSNTHLREKDMSLKAKGLLSLMLALPESWDYSVAGLVAICKEGRDTIEKTLKELKEFGYLVVDKIMPDKTPSGRIEYEYNIYEQPQKQGTEKQPLEKQPLVFQAQLNTNKSITKESNTDKYILEHFSEKVADAINKWLAYKREKGQTYKPRGLEVLLKNITKQIQANSEQFIIDAIEHSMMQNYSGIYPARKTQKASAEEEVSRHYSKEQLNGMFTSVDDIKNIEI